MSLEESFIDLLTYTFQATVFPTLTLGLGYLIGGRSKVGGVGGGLFDAKVSFGITPWKKDGTGCEQW